MVKVYLLKSGNVIIGNDNEETEILEDILTFLNVPMMGPTGIMFPVIMVQYGSPITQSLLSIEKDKLGIISEIKDYDSSLIEKYTEKIDSIKHPDIVIPESKSKLVIPN